LYKILASPQDYSLSEQANKDADMLFHAALEKPFINVANDLFFIKTGDFQKEKIKKSQATIKNCKLYTNHIEILKNINCETKRTIEAINLNNSDASCGDSTRYLNVTLPIVQEYIESMKSYEKEIRGADCSERQFYEWQYDRMLLVSLTEPQKYNLLGSAEERKEGLNFFLGELDKVEKEITKSLYTNKQEHDKLNKDYLHMRSEFISTLKPILPDLFLEHLGQENALNQIIKQFSFNKMR
jgi:hypothetical protein